MPSTFREMQDRYGIIIQARMSSNRLRGKSLLPIGPLPLIGHVLRRCQKLDIPLVVATSQDVTDDALADYVKDQGVPVFRGNLSNVLDRYIQCAKEFGFGHIIRITGDNPLVDIKALKESLHRFSGYTYLDGIYPGGWIKGTGFEVVTLKELESFVPRSADHTEHVTLGLREQLPERKDFVRLPIPPEQRFTDQIFLSCDYKEDLEVLQEIQQHLGPLESLEISDVIALFEECSDIFRKNAILHQK